MIYMIYTSDFVLLESATPALATPAWSAKTGRAPARHCKDARACVIYGHKTTAAHEIIRSYKYLPHPPPHPALYMAKLDSASPFFIFFWLSVFVERFRAACRQSLP